MFDMFVALIAEMGLGLLLKAMSNVKLFLSFLLFRWLIVPGPFPWPCPS